MAETNAQVALEAASRVHQRVGVGGNQYLNGKAETTLDGTVIRTAEAFLKWLNDNS